MQTYSASACLPSRLCSVVVESVLQGNILHIKILSAVDKCRCSSDSLDTAVGCVLDNRSLFRLSDNRQIVSANGCEHRLSQVIGAIGQEDIGTSSFSVAIHTVDIIDDINKTGGIAWLYKVPIALAGVVGLTGVDNAYTMNID